MATQNELFHNFGASTNHILNMTTAGSAYAMAATNMPPAFCMVQNVGTSPVYVRLTDDEIGNPASSSNYTLILAAGTTAADGQGGTLNLAGYTEKLSFISDTAGAKINISYSGRQGN